jgi:hypothetical protein
MGIEKYAAYLRFLYLVQAVEAKSKIRKLDSIETSLLNTLMARNFAGKTVFVGDLLLLKSIGSQATLHGRIKNLEELGYIQLLTQKHDGRQKLVTPTALAFRRLESLSKCLSG